MFYFKNQLRLNFVVYCQDDKITSNPGDKRPLFRFEVSKQTTQQIFDQSSSSGLLLFYSLYYTILPPTYLHCQKTTHCNTIQLRIQLYLTMYLQEARLKQIVTPNSGKMRSDSVSLYGEFVKRPLGSGSSLFWSSLTPAQLLWNITINLNGSRNFYVSLLVSGYISSALNSMFDIPKHCICERP